MGLWFWLLGLGQLHTLSLWQVTILDGARTESAWTNCSNNWFPIVSAAVTFKTLMGKIIGVPFRAESIIWIAHKKGKSVEALAEEFETTSNVIRVMLRRFQRHVNRRLLKPSGKDIA
jgi:hypothetical protein